MAYTRGNLAVKEKAHERGNQSQRYRETTKVVTRRAALPVREKLLYMFTIMFCVAVMGGLLWQNANLYNMKREMYNLNTDMQKLNAEMNELTIQKEKLEEQIPQEAAKLGYTESNEEGFHVQISTESGSKTANSEDAAKVARK
ncbi:hypothetical protein QNH46_16165 [Paenibacillus woosongensis]|uniref:Cell division protein FtsL n=1 Tax=Paenibacillus woosongensis TaxID=307580 RepID=A0A7X3CNC1_9BACL|nr:hypothetical protein [Paenibacillus woosongensis]MUG45012.1 hypothetical protein [Paenibacillus woosongensis]WHX47672.1 hypothetical protein QNH46_16165 [Paenibacillus woosongensis]GIP57789.1 hypothetical protein J15TS10_16030 [Paenibacillus woosongensis]